MRSKSFLVRSRPHRASRNSLDPYPSPASLPGEANEIFGDAEIVPDTFDERDAPPEKRPCLGTSETTRGGRRLNLEACIVCDISDELVSHCSGTDCFISFHGECLNPELSSSSSEDLAKSYCPYCWFKVLMMKHESVREKAVGAEKEVSKYLSKETKSKDQELRGEKSVSSSEKEQLQVEKDSDRSREEDMPLTEETDGQPQEDIEKFQDAEEDKDEETTKDQTEDKDVSPVLSGEEQDQIQQNEKPRRRRLQLILSDSEISSDESINERNGEGVTTPSGTMKNQQRKQSSTTKVVKSTTVRDMSSFKRDQRKRLFWTPEEEEMLKVGVEKFSAEAKKNMPWRKILEMGEEVFHETRTPADLKDKWRNMMGGRDKKTN
ncbi:hypothetical protein N665_0157s0227 [Sinapis alba]|nr:hypothetical protein N665_0157s0227 [Sinapis alba]